MRPRVEKKLRRGRGERGSAIIEFTIGAAVFLTAVFAVLEFGRLLWTHNALADAARRGARYAVNHNTLSAEEVRNVAVYGDPSGGSKPLVNNLRTSHVMVQYSTFSLGEGTVTVSVQNYDFDFVVPLVGRKVRMPAYSTTLTAENAGLVPPNL